MGAPLYHYKIGDFVKCVYHLTDLYSYLYEDEDNLPHFKYYGIIVDHTHNAWWHEIEPVYKIYCMDGTYRFFLEDEITLP